MWVLLFLVGLVALLLATQSLVLLAYNEPLQWNFGASSRQPRSLKLTLKSILLVVLVGSLVGIPYVVGSDPAAYYRPLLPRGGAAPFFAGQAIALAVLGAVFAIEHAGGWIRWERRWPLRKTLSKCLFTAVASVTVVAIEESFFRGIVLRTLVENGVPAFLALSLSATIFSAAHFLRRLKNKWPAVGLAVLGLWLGVAYLKTGNLWLSMGLHSGGILAIGVHRCFTRYHGREWLVGTQTFPIAGALCLAIMLAGTVITWLVL